MRFAALLFSFVIVVRAESPVTYECSPEDIEQFGLNCSDDEPCTVLLELASAEAVGNRILVTGNLHTRDATLLSLLLASDDGGVTWTEPVIRMRNAAFEQIEFWDGQTGWVSGESINPLARNPFLLQQFAVVERVFPQRGGFEDRPARGERDEQGEQQHDEAVDADDRPVHSSCSSSRLWISEAALASERSEWSSSVPR